MCHRQLLKMIMKTVSVRVPSTMDQFSNMRGGEGKGGQGSVGSYCGGEQFDIRSPLQCQPFEILNTWQHNSFFQTFTVDFNWTVVETDISVTQLCPLRLFSVCCCHSDLPGVCLDILFFATVYSGWLTVTHLINLFAGVTLSCRWQRSGLKGWFGFLQVRLCCQTQIVHLLWRGS